jgi:hypothetical protein
VYLSDGTQRNTTETEELCLIAPGTEIYNIKCIKEELIYI